MANASLVMRTCRADGTLLKPDAPAMPLDAFWLGSAFCNGNGGGDRSPPSTCRVARPAAGEVWATATRIGGGSGAAAAAAALVWPLVFAQLAANFSLPLPDVFQHLRGVPSIHRDGNVAPDGWRPPARGWVLFRPGAPLSRQPPVVIAANATLQLAAGSSYGEFTLAALAPIVAAVGGGPDWALLGAAEKFVPVSRQRIVDVAADASTLRVELIGAAAEVVVLQVALIVSRARSSSARHHGGGRSAAVREVVQQAVTLGGDGRGSATLDISK